jgi:cytoskeleton protein RodZ
VAKLAPTQVEQLQAIGAHLRQVRQEQGLSLDLLANQVFIRPALLQALEAGNDEILPEPVFIQGFIRRYGEALGLDGYTLSQDFSVTPVDVLPSPELIRTSDTNGVVEPETRHGLRVLEKSQPTHFPSRPTPTPGMTRPSTPLSAWLGLGAVAVLLIIGLWALFGRSQAPSVGTDTSPPVAEPEATEATAAEENGEGLEATPVADRVPQEAPVVVSISVTERAWMSVVADGTNLYEGTPDSGFEETWTAENSLVFRTGNAGGVTLSVNGDDPVVLGNTGVVRTLTLTPDSEAGDLSP